MRLSAIVYAVFLLCSIMLSNCAGFKKHMVSSAFNEVDTNKDGVVSREEFSQDMKKTAFAAVDKNGDGVITWEEWAAVDKTPEAKEHFALMDKDGNRIVDFLEFSEATEKYANINRAFVDLDMTRSGTLSPQEFQARPVFSIFTIRF